MAVDLKNTVDYAASLKPTGNRTAGGNGTVVDLQGAEGVLAVVDVDTLTDGTHNIIMQEGALADGSDMADVAAGDLQGAFVQLAAASRQTVQYRGNKAYGRLRNTATGTTTGGKYTAGFILGGIRKQP